MQTFLPYPSFELSAKALHFRHLGKQRSETKQIFNALTQNKGWVHHPATKMWAGHEYQLLQYGISICLEWIHRGYNDSLLEQFAALKTNLVDTGLPPWIGEPAFHEAHRSNLMRKKPEYYNFPNTKPLLPYQWPVLTNSGYYLKEGTPVK
jgi:hypothetical protein